MMVLVGFGVVTWLLVGPSLAWVMSRRGYDRTAWLLIGLLLPAIAVILALVELLWPASTSPRILTPGRVQPGSLDVLIHVDPSTGALESANVLAALRPRLRTLGLARVLPRGSGHLAERRTAGELCRDAEALGVPGAQLVVLFGCPQEALRHYATIANYSLVVTAERPRVAEALREGGQPAVAEEAEVASVLPLPPSDSDWMTSEPPAPDGSCGFSVTTAAGR